jgi:hypothetical protein
MKEAGTDAALALLLGWSLIPYVDYHNKVWWKPDGPEESCPGPMFRTMATGTPGIAARSASTVVWYETDWKCR